MKTANVLAFFKMERIFCAIAVDNSVEIFAGILCSTRAEPVQSERILIAFALVICVFPACVKLAENQFPVKAALVFVPINRAAASEILNLDGLVRIARNCYNVTVPLAGFVDCV